MTVISLEEFAEKCGKSPRQVRRYIKEGLIQAFRGKHGYTIPLEEMTKLGTSGRPHAGQDDNGEGSPMSEAGTGSVSEERTFVDTSALGMALAGLRTAQQQTAEVLTHLRGTQEAKERAERQLDVLRSDYRQAQLSLAESAESLMEKEAHARHADILRQENLRNQELWQAEKAQLISELSHHQERVNWLEKRVPRWVRGIFGAK